MDYKKKYEELVGKIEKAYLFAQTNSTKAVLEEIRPELKESDDERIKNVIYGWIYIQPSQFFDNGFSKEEMLAWLEKQGQVKESVISQHENKTCKENGNSLTSEDEQKTSDKVEPKFNFSVGQWIVATGKCVYLITKIDGFNVTLIDVDGNEYVFDTTSLEEAHLWTIQDAKDGDVLATSAGAFIYNGNNGGGSCPGSYCGINSLGRFQTGVKTHWTWENVCPATKEQRDTLEKAMADAGWKFDFEKKKLKKIEQKPAWSEDDEQMVEDIIEAIDTQYASSDYNEMVNWLLSLKDRVGCEANSTTTWKPSEEQIQCLHDAIEHYQTNGHPASKLNELYEQMSKIYKL